MSIVTRGLGQPEDGALVALGLGLSTAVEPDGIMACVAAGSGSMTCTLSTSTRTVGGAPSFGPVVVIPPTRKPTTYADLAATITGSSSVSATLDYSLNVDLLVAQLTDALLLDLV